ncbi:hypothetical protein [Clostridium sp.]|uniref:hypothetical protein n=1 Tax=Clostridium sp. TaxID=1506 RepID=UPI003D6D3EC4
MKNSKLLILATVSTITLILTLTGYNPKIDHKVFASNGAIAVPSTQPIKMTNTKLLGAKVAIPKVPVLMYHSVTSDKNNTNELKVSQSSKLN